ncbi:transglycosylase SLT domain-containing protein [Humitalea sp. 24SJ18S-53]|uniref:lytic transglycosylase domain-containing protein n=1 Tax=Humitalea sp. 24SJ18S-53 TaxID=3422307 RepID=UPI003D674913
MRQESGGRVSATSPVGAMGLMQVMPGTYAELRSRHGLGSDPYHPWDSIMAGTAYLRQMYDLYGNPAFLAAYNAGPRRLEDYLWSGRGLPAETRNYVARIGPRIVDARPNRRAAPEIYAAAEIPLSIPAGPRRMDAGTLMALREQRSRAETVVQVASLPPGPVVRMEPIPDGSTYAINDLPPPAATGGDRVQIASLDGGPVTRMDPIVSPGDFLPQPSSHVEVTTLAPPVTAVRDPVAAARRGAAPTFASQGAMPQATAPQAGRPASGAPRVALASVPPPATASRTLTLVPQASAGTLPGGLRAAAAPVGAWAVQVGAFSSEQQARGAATAARDAVGQANARPVVMPVAQGRVTLWRARVTGLSREGAAQTCERLRGRGNCIVVNPEG